MNSILQFWRMLSRDFFALFLAVRDPRVPLPAKAFAVLTLLYVFSPIDLFSDIIPFAGIIDDALIIPFGMNLAERFIPGYVLEEHRRKADAIKSRAYKFGLIAGLVLLWVAVILIALWIFR